jgi:ABC-type polysaccharide/polyol phosphate transport system ATPase subunit
MSENYPAIDFSNVSMSFRVTSEDRVTTFKEWLVRRLSGRPIRSHRFTALDGVSCAVEKGRALGVIGRNGAGKSTLLRIAAGILQPETGVAIVRGTIAPVIELGIGFEHELTGRENIVFNGALLGRSRPEMRQRMQEIVDFAELGDFIEQPIRTYSTGMLARLAFAVATTVDARVLLLDEVLSVGDEGFKQKCRARMLGFRDSGVTVLYVSHDLDAVKELCDEALWLDRGRIRQVGPASDVVDAYHRETAASAESGEAG